MSSINWTDGNGSGRLVVVKAGSPVDAFPVDGATYTASATFGSGTQIGTGNYVVHAGSGPIATLSGLTRDVVYHFRVFEYNGTLGSTANFMTNAASGNPTNQTTLALNPSTPTATNLVANPIGSTTATLNWTMGDGANALVVMKANTSGIADPSDKSTYTADPGFGIGSNLGSDSYVVYKGTGTSVAVTNLSPGTRYYFAVYMYNGSTPGAENYRTSDEPKVDFYTLVAAPATQAASIVFSNVDKTTMDVSWTSGSGANRLVVVRAVDPVDFVPAGGSTYVGVNADFSLADDQGSGNKIVYSGSGSSVSLSGLTKGTTYYVQVFEFDGSGATINYNVNAATGNPASQKTLDDEPPTVQATALGVTAFGEDTLTLGWTRGDGDKALVVGREGLAAGQPVDGESYVGNAALGSGSAVPASGLSTAVYADVGTSVAVTGLSPATEYHFAAYEYNESGYKYLLTDAPTASRWTLSTEPANHVTDFVTNGATSASIDLDWTASAGTPAPDGYLIVRKAGGAPTFVPTDGDLYTGAQGDSVVTVVTPGTAESRTILSLAPETTYHFAIYPFRRVDGESETYNYKTNGTVPSASGTTLPALLIKDQFTGYSGALDGENGGTGWGAAWSVAMDNQGSATVEINSGSLDCPAGYPTNTGDKVQVGLFELQTDPAFRASRTFDEPFSEGRIYAAALLKYDWQNDGVFFGISLLSNATEKAFIGRPSQNNPVFGVDSYGGGQNTTTRNFYGGNTYLVVVRYNFETRKLAGLIYNSAVAGGVPEQEPGTWDFEVDVAEGHLDQVTGMRITGGKKGGTFWFDEIRVGNSWSGLMGHTGSDEDYAPTVQASQFQFSNEATNRFTAGFVRGNGAAVLVLARKDGAVDAMPVDGQTYTANSAFGSGSQIGTGNYVVYAGSEPFPSFVLQGLVGESTYHLRAFEYNEGTGTKYLTNAATANPSSYTTLSPPTGVSIGLAGTTATDLAWTQWNSRYVMVVYNVNAAVTFKPTDGVDYGTGAQTGGTILDAGTDSKTTLSHTGLTPGDTIYYKFFSRMSAGGNHYYSDPASGSIQLVESTLTLYDGFPRSGEGLDLNSNAGGTGWGANLWAVSDSYGDNSGSVVYDAGSLPGTTAAGATGNKVLFYGANDSRDIQATRTMNTAISDGVYYLSWRQNHAYGGSDNYAGVRLLSSGGATKAFIGKYYDSGNLRIAEYGDMKTSGQAIDNGAGNDNVVVVKLELDGSGNNDVIRANVYKSGSRLLGEEPIEWDVAITNAIDNVGQIQLRCGANDGHQIGLTYFDEIRMAQNWTETARYDGQSYRTMMEAGPTPELVFIGTDYAAGTSPVKTSITDADLADAGNWIDIAVRWTSPFGVFLTNTVEALNTNSSAILSTSGNVVPNWDPLRRSGGVDNSLGFDSPFTTFVGQNGAAVVTSYYESAFTGTNFGTWDIGDEFMITVSGQTYPSSGAKVTAPSGGEQVPDRRAFSINLELPFTVVDDDPEPPVVQGFDLVQYTDAQMTNGFSISGEIMDEYSGVDPASIQFSLINSDTNTVFANEDFGTRPTSTNQTKGIFANLAHNVDPVPWADNRIGTWSLEVHGTDVDDDRADDEASTNQVFQFAVVDDDPEPPAMLNISYDGFTLNNRSFLVATNGYVVAGDTGTETIRGIYNRRSGTGTNTTWALTDAELANADNLRFVFGARDVHGRLSRGTVGTDVMAFTLQEAMTNHVGRWSAALSTVLAATNEPATNVWQFANGDFTDEMIDALIARTSAGSSSVMVATAPDDDNDRPSDRGIITNQVGLIKAYDDDIRGPVVRKLDVEGAYGAADTVFSSFEVGDGWPVGGSSAPHDYTQVDSEGRTWAGHGAMRTTLDPKFTSTYRMGLLVTAYADPWFELPPIENPGTLSVFAGRFSGADVELRAEYNNAGTWTSLGGLMVTNTTDSFPAYEKYDWTINMTGVVTLRLARAATGPQIYFDDVEVLPAPIWTNTNQLEAAWTEAQDDYSGVSEYRLVIPSRTSAVPVATNDGTHVSAATTNSTISLSTHKDEQGVLTGYLVAIDGDGDRTADRSMGSVRPIQVKVDRTPPTEVPLTSISTDDVDDPGSQFDLVWSTTGVGPDDPGSSAYPDWGKVKKAPNDPFLLSPWDTYKIYYGPQDGMDAAAINAFLGAGTYKTDPAWKSVVSTTDVLDVSAGGTNYFALTNASQNKIRLYDLESGEDFVVVVVGVDEAGNEGPATPDAWGTNNTVRFAVTSGWTVAKSYARDRFGDVPSLNNTASSNASALGWVAAGQKNGTGAVSRVYDLISRDSTSFNEDSNNVWGLVGNVQSNWFVDDGGQFKGRGQMRFYRAAYLNRWKTTNSLGQPQRPQASAEVYAQHNVLLSEGFNYVGLHGVPYTNTFAGVFGTDLKRWPAGMHAGLSTRVEFYSPGTNALLTSSYYFGTDGNWRNDVGTVVTHVLQADDFFTRGFSITLPQLSEEYRTANAKDSAQPGISVPAMIWTPVMQVPTNAPGGGSFSHVIMTGGRDPRGRVTNSYNLVSLNLPVAAHPHSMRLLESGFVPAVNSRPATGDQLYAVDTSIKGVMSGRSIYFDAEATNGLPSYEHWKGWKFLADDSFVEWGHFKPNDVVVIVSRNWVGSGYWTWTYHPTNFYDLPTRWMEPE